MNKKMRNVKKVLSAVLMTVLTFVWTFASTDLDVSAAYQSLDNNHTSFRINNSEDHYTLDQIPFNNSLYCTLYVEDGSIEVLSGTNFNLNGSIFLGAKGGFSINGNATITVIQTSTDEVPDDNNPGDFITVHTPCTLSSGKNLNVETLGNGGNFYNQGNVNASATFENSYVFTLFSGATLTTQDEFINWQTGTIENPATITAQNTLVNEGTINSSSGTITAKDFTNKGRFTGTLNSLSTSPTNNTVTLEKTDFYSKTNNATYNLKGSGSSITMTGFDTSYNIGTVIADADTMIYASEGNNPKFTLQVGSDTKLVTKPLDENGERAADVIKPDQDPQFAGLTVHVGDNVTMASFKSNITGIADNPNYTVKFINATTGTESTTVPTAAGEYNVKISIPATTNYRKYEGIFTDKFIIEKYDQEPHLIGSQSSMYYGQDVDMDDIKNRITDIEDSAEISDIYFLDSTGNSFTDIPSDQGSYYIHITIPATASYNEFDGNLSELFTVNVLSNLQGERCSIETTPVGQYAGTDLYDEPVTLKAPDGFYMGMTEEELLHELEEEEIEEEGYFDGISRYFRRKSDGAITPWVVGYSGSFYIDTEAPRIMEGMGFLSNPHAQDETNMVHGDLGANNDYVEPEMVEIEDGVIINSDYLMFYVNDYAGYTPMLKTLTVNGENVEFEGGEGTVELTLSAPGRKTFTVAASDFAGHTSTWRITLNNKVIEAPENPYSVQGTKGKNGYYVSSIYIIPAEGYTISDTFNGVYEDSLLYEEGLENIYLCRKSDGAVTEAIPFEESLLIDKDKPVFSEKCKDEKGKEYTLKNNQSYHVRSLSFSVSDKNLASVTVNGEAQEVKDGKVNLTLKADAEKALKYKIVAEDKAGNTSEMNIEVEYVKTVTEGKVSVDDTYYGVGIKVKIEKNSDATPQITFKEKGSSDSKYTTNVPTKVGDYIVRAIIPSNDEYTSLEVTDTFSIKYLPAPSTPFTVSGLTGNNDFYISDVYLDAPQGYLIATEVDGNYTDRILYAEGISHVAYKRISDGAKTDAYALGKTIKIDKDTPAINGEIKNQSNASIGLRNGQTYSADTITFTIADKNLKSVKVNGDTVTINDNSALITLDSNYGIKDFTITAEDEAGNTYTMKITMRATWMESGVIPVGVKIPLFPGTEYFLGEGLWQISGDPNVYAGGISFFIETDGEYIFTKIE